MQSHTQPPPQSCPSLISRFARMPNADWQTDRPWCVVVNKTLMILGYLLSVICYSLITMICCETMNAAIASVAEYSLETAPIVTGKLSLCRISLGHLLTAVLFVRHTFVCLPLCEQCNSKTLLADFSKHNVKFYSSFSFKPQKGI